MRKIMGKWWCSEIFQLQLWYVSTYTQKTSGNGNMCPLKMRFCFHSTRNKISFPLHLKQNSVSGLPYSINPNTLLWYNDTHHCANHLTWRLLPVIVIQLLPFTLLFLVTALLVFFTAAKMTRYWARFKQNDLQNCAIREILAEFYRIAPQNRAELLGKLSLLIPLYVQMSVPIPNNVQTNFDPSLQDLCYSFSRGTRCH
jgi:hypothetical protein